MSVTGVPDRDEHAPTAHPKLSCNISAAHIVVKYPQHHSSSVRLHRSLQILLPSTASARSQRESERLESG